MITEQTADIIIITSTNSEYIAIIQRKHTGSVLNRSGEATSCTKMIQIAEQMQHNHSAVSFIKEIEAFKTKLSYQVRRNNVNSRIYDDELSNLRKNYDVAADRESGQCRHFSVIKTMLYRHRHEIMTQLPRKSNGPVEREGVLVLAEFRESQYLYSQLTRTSSRFARETFYFQKGHLPQQPSFYSPAVHYSC